MGQPSPAEISSAVERLVSALRNDDYAAAIRTGEYLRNGFDATHGPDHFLSRIARGMISSLRFKLKSGPAGWRIATPLV